MKREKKLCSDNFLVLRKLFIDNQLTYAQQESYNYLSTRDTRLVHVPFKKEKVETLLHRIRA